MSVTRLRTIGERSFHVRAWNHLLGSITAAFTLTVFNPFTP